MSYKFAANFFVTFKDNKWSIEMGKYCSESWHVEVEDYDIEYIVDDERFTSIADKSLTYFVYVEGVIWFESSYNWEYGVNDWDKECEINVIKIEVCGPNDEGNNGEAQ